MRWPLRRRRSTGDFSAEVESHLAMEAARLVRLGMTPEDAVFAARRAFGNATATRERFRDSQTYAWIEHLIQDVRYGLRAMRRSPGFTTVAVLSLALGIGANTAIFSVNDALILRTLPVRAPDDLVRFGRANGDDSFTYPQFRDVASSPVFDGVTAIVHVDRSNVTASGPGGGFDPAPVQVALVSGDYFHALGVGSANGRTLAPDDDRVRDGAPVAVISHAYWQRRFALASDVVGRTLTLSGTTYTIVGIAQAGFAGEWVGRPTDLWLPLAMQSEAMPDRPGMLDDTRSHWLKIMARLRPGVARQEAAAAAEVASSRGVHDRREDATPLVLHSGARGYSPQRAYFGESLSIVATLAGLLLLIACANIASLLLARSAARQREIALRLAIGAGRWRIVRQLLTESALLAASGGALGIVLASLARTALSTSLASGPARMASVMTVRYATLDARIDVRTLTFAVLACALATMLFGLAPAFRSSRVALASALTARRAIGGAGGGRFGLGKALVVAQVAFSVLLLTAAGLFARSLLHLRSQDLGVDDRHTLLVWTSPEQTGKVRSALVPLVQDVRQRLSSVPGVVAVAAATQGLLDGGVDGGASENIRIEGRDAQPGLRKRITIVSPDYFKVLGIPVLRGREFTSDDTERSRPVVIITDNLARLLFGNEDPIGRRIKLSRDTTLAWTEIVGVVKSGAYWSPFNPRLAVTFVPYTQGVAQHEPVLSMVVLVHAAGDPTALAPAIRADLRAMDPNLPVVRVNTIKQQLDDLLVNERLLAALASLCGALSVLLACLGLYGVVSYTTARRTSEIGVRMALGATRRGVVQMVLAESMSLVVAGIVFGVPAAFICARLVSSRLFGVSATDTLTFASVPVLIVSVAAVAGLLPARRAAHVDPMEALRAE